ncbi:Hypothetical protein CGLY_00510 [Corynebacterium glyciniphilum AJ 3170]|uniref:Uncharacterized protein n=1 Tax=Corynebacterium glyciniphilum AJ 3170 TaxID=1404245 RepID=X5E4Z7_9CORY|nr:hypothetical protein [Corynebacterium glyciniphilum]AHW62550.1 Hypothetical protein CGLY_00510 [Corynebacterium glyciniphilum AJ 3170]
MASRTGSTPSVERRRALLTGVGSLVDLHGGATYRRMQELMPAPKRPMTRGELEQLLQRLDSQA